MPVSVVVGGQFGSEGKGKVAHFVAREMEAAAAVRVGGPNSGHTVIGPNGAVMIFRQLPTACILADVKCALPAGAYLDIAILLSEIKMAEISPERLCIDPQAVIITEDDRQREARSELRERIGSTLSGTGAAVANRVSRDMALGLAKDEPLLKRYIKPVAEELREILSRSGRVVIEGTQGFGLSLLHGPYPTVTSRDTTAAAFVAEAGLSPRDVDDIILVIRAFPIRVPGSSGFLPREIDWTTLTRESGSPVRIVEYTSATKGVRRVARFDAEVVRRAILVNQPTRIVLNHLDYVDVPAAAAGTLSGHMLHFVAETSGGIGRAIDYFGLSPELLTASEDIPLRPLR